MESSRPGVSDDARKLRTVSTLVEVLVTAQPDGSSPGNKVSLAGLGFTTGAGTLGIVKSGPAGYAESMPPDIFNNFTVGNPLTNMKSVDNNYMVTDTVAKILGNHSLTTGGEYRYYQLNVRNVCAPNGQFNFTGSETNVDYADFLIGAPTTYTQCSEQLLDNRAKYGALFIQDSWKVKSSVTLNAGLRWDVAVPWSDKYAQSQLPAEVNTAGVTVQKSLTSPLMCQGISGTGRDTRRHGGLSCQCCRCRPGQRRCFR
jgi:hypothetical protein